MNERLVISFNRNVILYFVLLFPFCPIDYFCSTFVAWDNICKYLRYLFLIVLILRHFLYRRKLTFPFVMSVLFVLAALFSSCLGIEGVIRTLHYGVCLIGIELIVEDGLFFDKDSFVKGTLLLFELFVYLNLIYYVFNPNGYMPLDHNSPYYLFGNYNTTIRKLCPGLVLGAFIAVKSKGRIITMRYVVMMAALLVFLLGVGAVTASIGIVLFIIAILCYAITKHYLIFKYGYFFIISAAVSALFVLAANFGFLSNIIVNFLGKDMTLSGRTIIWAQALRVIPGRLVLGYGQLSGETMRMLIGGVAAHNVFLDILLYGGIVNAILYGVLLWGTWRKLFAYRNLNSPIIAVFNCIFCMIFIMWNFEPYASLEELSKYYMIFVMTYYCKDFIEFQYIPDKTTPNRTVLQRKLVKSELSLGDH